MSASFDSSLVAGLLPMLALLGGAAITDWRTRRIPNGLTIGLIAGGIIASACWSIAVITPSQAVLGMMTGLGLAFVPFALGALGGGDVKLLSGIGAWVGPAAVFHVFLIAAVVGLLIVLVQCAWQGRLFALFRNSAVLVMNLTQMETLGVQHVSEVGRSFRSVDRPLPYAVPVLVATCSVVAIWM